MSEEWRPILGGIYAVSSEGRVRRESPGRGARAGRVLRVQTGRIGYLTVSPSLGGRSRQRSRLVHRLVAEAFLGPCPSGKEVNHRNGDKTDARIANLEYVTSSENRQHALRTGLAPKPPGLLGERHPRAKLNNAAVQDIRARVAAGEPRKDIAARYGVCVSSVQQIHARITWGHVQ